MSSSVCHCGHASDAHNAKQDTACRLCQCSAFEPAPPQLPVASASAPLSQQIAMAKHYVNDANNRLQRLRKQWHLMQIKAALEGTEHDYEGSCSDASPGLSKHCIRCVLLQLQTVNK